MAARRWTFLPSPELGRTLRERLASVPREPDMLVYGLRCLAALGIRAWLRLWHRLEIVGGPLPTRSFILVCNHASHLDTLCLLAALPLARLHRTFPAAAADTFFVGPARGSLSALLFNAIPFHRGEGASRSIALCRALLRGRGHILLLFPEGTRSPDGHLGPFRPGVGWLAAGHPVPVVPCHLAGAYRALPRGAWLPRPVRLRLTLGVPMAFGHLPETPEAALEVATRLQEAVAALAPPGPGVQRAGPSSADP